MAGKYAVTYLAFIIYVVCVLLITLLVTLLASLAGINKTNCNKNDNNVVKRDVSSDSSYEELENPVKVTYHQHPKVLKQLEIRRALRKRAAENSFLQSNKLGSKAGNDDCPQFLQYQNDTLWESIRLPTNLRPKNYDLELSVPKRGQETYGGKVKIEIQVLQDTQYIIFHAVSLEFEDSDLTDTNGNSIDIECGGFYALNDYYVIIAKNKITTAMSPLTLDITFVANLKSSEQGLFDINYDDGQSTELLVSYFEPLDARTAFPCFDDPGYKAPITIKIDHPVGTLAVSNMPGTTQTIPEGLQTTFEATPNIPTYLHAIAVFDENDFAAVGNQTGLGTTINVWARKKYVVDGFAKDPLDMAINIYDQIEALFEEIGFGETGPKVINMLAVPDYPAEAIAHWGLPIFRETKLLFKDETTTEASKQQIALLIAKQFAQFWFGNAVTFKWWDQVWLQEGISDYLKYKFVDYGYQDWRVADQFVTEELINVLVSDGYPSTHPVVKPINNPYDIDELFDDVETSKVAAILRMVEFQFREEFMLERLGQYLNNSLQFNDGNGDPQVFFDAIGQIRKWDASDFMDRWFLQSNYPIVFVNIKYNASSSTQYVELLQDRFVNSEDSIFGLEDLYPSPFDYVWFIPVTCQFGRSVDEKEPHFERFDFDTRQATFDLPNDNGNYTWVHCDEDFQGYYTLSYSRDNWRTLAELLKNKYERFGPLERANIIHNIFSNAYSERDRYDEVVNVLSYLRKEEDYIPWKTVSKHVKDMVGVLDYRPSFYAVSDFFRFELRLLEQDPDIWQAEGDHVKELTKSTILELACRLQDFECLEKASTFWPELSNSLSTGAPNSVPIHIRPIAYNYHFQNTYRLKDWDVAFLNYEAVNDIQEEERLLEALTFSRIPSQLARFIESQKEGGLRNIDLLDATLFFARNPLGRELIWNYYRSNYQNLVDIYSLDNPILGRLLIEIVSTFEDEFLFYELTRFTIDNPAGASEEARFKAFEIVSTNIVWLFDKEAEIEAAFRPRSTTSTGARKQLAGFRHGTDDKEQFLAKAREQVKQMKNSRKI